MGFDYNHSKQVEESVRRVSAHTPSRMIRPEEVRVALSWKRSLVEHSLDPGLPGIEAVLEEPHLRRRRDQLGELYSIARAEMRDLYRQIAQSGHSVLLTDADGYVLDRLGDPGLTKQFERVGLLPGADWSESTVGTNGIGTCIAEKRSVTIHRNEHFLCRNMELSCTAAPICDPHGRMVAVLDVSSAQASCDREVPIHTIALVRTSARIIENLFFLNYYRNEIVLRFNETASSIDSPSAGMVAVDRDGRTLAFNKRARDLCAIRSADSVVNESVEERFGITANSLHKTALVQGDTPMRLRDIRSGMELIGTLRGPSIKASPNVRSKRVGDDPAGGECGEAGELSLDAMAHNADEQVRRIVRCARRVLDRDVPIVLCGETGTGKEVLARAIHNASTRHKRPFVAMNCAAIPESLIESELFGYRHGAFTGAKREGMRGKVLESSGGTLFLDEIGDMPSELQTRFLRVLEQKQITPLGSEEVVPVELNVISATHRNLQQLVEDGLFREDLYYRLNSIALELPALRERSDKDRVITAALTAESGGDQDVSIDEAAYQRLLDYRWPGNIRQLRHCLRTALALCDDGIIRVRDLPRVIVGEEDFISPAVSGGVSGRDSLETVEDAYGQINSPLEDAERDTLLRELRRHRWNITKTADKLNISRNTLYRKLKKYRIDTES
ncbi:sigma-54-dependent Fis family transcriptional regulator [Spiribacter roseus]|uniref:sigma-54-dependent Fis family transcriptional regulator n=1 Tax=Spiribacter roseus TaxID=1855875 RepID=UPI0012FE5EBB